MSTFPVPDRIRKIRGMKEAKARLAKRMKDQHTLRVLKAAVVATLDEYIGELEHGSADIPAGDGPLEVLADFLLYLEIAGPEQIREVNEP